MNVCWLYYAYLYGLLLSQYMGSSKRPAGCKENTVPKGDIKITPNGFGADD